MGLIFVGERYAGKTKKPVYSSGDGKWYKDREHTIPVHPDEYKEYGYGIPEAGK